MGMTAKQIRDEFNRERHDVKGKDVIVCNSADGSELQVMSVEDDPDNNCVRLIVGVPQSEE